MAKGGFRQGSGRKRKQKSWSDKFKAKIWRSLEKEAKKQGKTVFQLFAEMFYNPNIQDSVFASLWKSLCEVMAEKESRTTIEEHKFTGPVIGLPPIKERPKLTEEDTPKA
jgi:hypothetical protein